MTVTPSCLERYQNNKYSEMFQLWEGYSPVDRENSLKKEKEKKGKNEEIKMQLNSAYIQSLVNSFNPGHQLQLSDVTDRLVCTWTCAKYTLIEQLMVQPEFFFFF